MSDDRMANGIIRISPPLNWAEIREFNGRIEKSKRHFVMALSCSSKVEHTDQGEYKIYSSNMAEVYGPEGAYGVEEFLLLMGELFGKDHDLTGYVVVVEPQCEQDFNEGQNQDAVRYSFEKGKLMKQYPIISWGKAVAYK